MACCRSLKVTVTAGILHTPRFVADRGFAGSDRNSRRAGLVQFEQKGEDEYGLGQFLEEANRGDIKRKTDDSRSSREFDSNKSRKEARLVERDQT